MLFVIVGTVLGALVAAGVAAVAPSTYTARVTILVAPAGDGTTITNSDVEVAQAYLPTLAELVTIRPILDHVVAATGLGQDSETLARVVTTHVPVGTSLLTIAVSDRDGVAASTLANGIASELGSYVAPGGPATNGPRLSLTVVDPATPPSTRDGPGLAVRMALGGAIALFLTISIAFLVENAGRGAQSLGRGIEGISLRSKLGQHDGTRRVSPTDLGDAPVLGPSREPAAAYPSAAAERTAPRPRARARGRSGLVPPDGSERDA